MQWSSQQEHIRGTKKKRSIKGKTLRLARKTLWLAAVIIDADGWHGLGLLGRSLLIYSPPPPPPADAVRHTEATGNSIRCPSTARAVAAAPASCLPFSIIAFSSRAIVPKPSHVHYALSDLSFVYFVRFQLAPKSCFHPTTVQRFGNSVVV